MNELDPIIEALDVESSTTAIPGQLRQTWSRVARPRAAAVLPCPGLGTCRYLSRQRRQYSRAAARSSYKPANCISYYPVKYANKKAPGLDLYSAAALILHPADRAVPTTPTERCRTWSLYRRPPDGIACVKGRRAAK
jgi:hypothetical protein